MKSSGNEVKGKEMATYAIRTRTSFDLYKRSRPIHVPVSNQYAQLPSRKCPPSRRSALKKRYALVFVLAIFILASLLFPAAEAFGGKTLVSSERQSADVQEIQVVVQPGDTLWSIAKELEPNTDPRKTIEQISKARGTSPLKVGEKITWSK